MYFAVYSDSDFSMSSSLTLDATHSSSWQQQPVISVRLTLILSLSSMTAHLLSLASVASLHTLSPLSMFSEPQQSRISAYFDSSKSDFSMNVIFAQVPVSPQSVLVKFVFPAQDGTSSTMSLHW